MTVRSRQLIVRSSAAVTLAVGLCLGGAPAASAADPLVVTDVDVLPVLADFPYDPVLVGDVATPFGGDPDDCSITGYEDRSTFGNGVYAATGCGGARLRFSAQGTSVGGIVGASVTATHVYGCVDPLRGAARATVTRTDRLAGLPPTYSLSTVDGVRPTALGFAALLRPVDVVCEPDEQPAQLSITLSDLAVTLRPAPYSVALGPQQVPGTWSLAFDPPPGRISVLSTALRTTLDGYRDSGQLAATTAAGLSDRLTRAVDAAEAGSELRAIGYLEQFAARARNQVRGDAADTAAREALVAGADALVAALREADEQEAS